MTAKTAEKIANAVGTSIVHFINFLIDGLIVKLLLPVLMHTHLSFLYCLGWVLLFRVLFQVQEVRILK